MKNEILEHLKSDKHNYHTYPKLSNIFGTCQNELDELVSEGLIIERPGASNKLYKVK